MNTIKFYSNEENYKEFSNFYKKLFMLDGVVYPTSEHAYQVQKFLGPDATERSIAYANIIFNEVSTSKVKILANQKNVGGYKWKTDLNPIISQYQDVKIRHDWEDVKDDVMRKIVFEKFNQNLDLKMLLLNTGDAKIEENSPYDYYWGIGKAGTGKNMLGIILMEVRDALRFI